MALDMCWKLADGVGGGHLGVSDVVLRLEVATESGFVYEISILLFASSKMTSALQTSHSHYYLAFIP